MPYFNGLKKEQWNCSLSIRKLLEEASRKKEMRGVYKKDKEYVVVWYNYQLYSKNTQALVEVKFIELDGSTYQKGIKKYHSFMIVKLPVNYLHKVAFGTIWKNGVSTERFILPEYEVTITADRGNIKSEAIYGSKDKSDFFHYHDYAEFDDVDYFKIDKNSLINIKYNNKLYTIHPLQFYLAYYGYSNEIKRILMMYKWDAVLNKLKINKNVDIALDEYVVLPRIFSENDAIFLYYLKYDKYTKGVIREFNNSILKNIENRETYEVPCWHEQSIKLSFRGIELGGTVLCCGITGISLPAGDAINVVLPPNVNYKKGNSQTNTKISYQTVKLDRVDRFVKLDVTFNPVNNLVISSVLEALKNLGDERQIIEYKAGGKTYLDQDNTRIVPVSGANSDSVTDKYGALINTGNWSGFDEQLLCGDNLDGKTRLKIVWDHAIRLRNEMNASVFWFSPKCKFNDSSPPKFIKLNTLCEEFEKDYPDAALVLYIKVQSRKFFVLNFPEKSDGSGFSSVVYETEDIEKFLLGGEGKEDTLIRLLCEIVELDAIGPDYVDSKNGRLVKFIHRQGKINNWVRNGLEKLLW